MPARPLLLLPCLLVCWLAGCATPEEERHERLAELQTRQVKAGIYDKFAHDDKLTLDEVLYLVKHGVDDDTITDQMEAAHAVYRPTQKEFETLSKGGASPDLLSYIVETGGGRLVDRNAGPVVVGDYYSPYGYGGVGPYYDGGPYYRGSYLGGYYYGGYGRYNRYGRDGRWDRDDHDRDHHSRYLPPDPIREHVFH